MPGPGAGNPQHVEKKIIHFIIIIHNRQFMCSKKRINPHYFNPKGET